MWILNCAFKSKLTKQIFLNYVSRFSKMFLPVQIKNWNRKFSIKNGKYIIIKSKTPLSTDLKAVNINVLCLRFTLLVKFSLSITQTSLSSKIWLLLKYTFLNKWAEWKYILQSLLLLCDRLNFKNFHSIKRSMKEKLFGRNTPNTTRM